jgi:hypothetical protein
MFEPVWSRVVMGHYASEAASIRGFRRLAVHDKEHPALVIARGGAEILGRVYFDVRHSDVERLDAFETQRYARVTVPTKTQLDERLVLAQAYLALNLAELSELDWDVSRFEREGLPKFMASYVEKHAPPK